MTQREYAKRVLEAFGILRMTCPNGDPKRQFELVALWYPLWRAATVESLPEG